MLIHDRPAGDRDVRRRQPDDEEIALHRGHRPVEADLGQPGPACLELPGVEQPDASERFGGARMERHLSVVRQRARRVFDHSEADIERSRGS